MVEKLKRFLTLFVLLCFHYFKVMSGKEDEQVLSVWSVKDLVQDPIYSEMVLFNQLTIKEQIVNLTNFLEPEPAKPEASDKPAEPETK